MEHVRARATNDLLKDFIAFLNTPITLPKWSAETKNKTSNTRQGLVSIEGELQLGRTLNYSINGQDFSYNENTCIVGKVQLGAIARVKLRTTQGKGAFATSIVITKPTACH